MTLHGVVSPEKCPNVFCIAIPSAPQCRDYSQIRTKHHSRVPRERYTLQGYLVNKKMPPPKVYHEAVTVGLLKDPRGTLFLMSEVPL